jgi:regulatory protein
MSASAYVDALKLLARRELSEAQIRQRLARRGHSGDAIDSAVTRLKEERALDDTRVAEAIARTQTALKGRGRVRVRREMERAGIGADDAARAMDAVFADVDADQLLEKALARRMRGRDVVDDSVFRRLYRYLLGQGFEHDRIIKALSGVQMAAKKPDV